MYPSRDEFIRLAKTSNLIPVYREVFADTETPISVFRKMGTGPYSFLLESVEGGEKWARFSFMGIDPMFTFKSRGSYTIIQSCNGSEEQTVDDPLRLLQTRLADYRPARLDGLPRFFGGAVGYMGYEMVSLSLIHI